MVVIASTVTKHLFNFCIIIFLFLPYISKTHYRILFIIFNIYSYIHPTLCPLYLMPVRFLLISIDHIYMYLDMN